MNCGYLLAYLLGVASVFVARASSRPRPITRDRSFVKSADVAAALRRLH